LLGQLVRIKLVFWGLGGFNESGFLLASHCINAWDTSFGIDSLHTFFLHSMLCKMTFLECMRELSLLLSQEAIVRATQHKAFSLRTRHTWKQSTRKKILNNEYKRLKGMLSIILQNIESIHWMMRISGWLVTCKGRFGGDAFLCCW
jgi:hypothetical protein